MTVLKKEKTATFTGKQLCWSPLLIDLPASRLVDIRCHSLYHSLSFLITRCHSLSFVVTRCHSLPFDVPLVCLFINDQFVVGNSASTEASELSNIDITEFRCLDFSNVSLKFLTLRSLKSTRKSIK